MTRGQLLALGFGHEAIKHRIATGRLHPVWRGVYAVGRPELTRLGRWMAAVLSCGAGAVLSHESAACLWGIRTAESDFIEVSVPRPRHPRRDGIVIFRRTGLGNQQLTRRHGIPVTTPLCTFIELATRLGTDQLEAAVNEADKLDLVHAPDLRRALSGCSPRPGLAVLKRTLDRRTFTLTDSQLERLFLRLVRPARLPQPLTGQWLNGYRVDFFWPDLGLVVETDGLRYHRTPAQQNRDRVRDHAHTSAGLTTLRFTHAQVTFEPEHVEQTLRAVARRLAKARGHGG